MATTHPGSKAELAAGSNSAIENRRQALFDLSKDVHAHPELNYQEYYSSDALARFLEQNNLHVERGIGGVETAFKATIPGGGGDGPTIAVLAEYDALPEIGHGCGHKPHRHGRHGRGVGPASQRAEPAGPR